MLTCGGERHQGHHSPATTLLCLHKAGLATTNNVNFSLNTATHQAFTPSGFPVCQARGTSFPPSAAPPHLHDTQVPTQHCLFQDEQRHPSTLTTPHLPPSPSPTNELTQIITFQTLNKLYTKTSFITKTLPPSLLPLPLTLLPPPTFLLSRLLFFLLVPPFSPCLLFLWHMTIIFQIQRKKM